MGAGTNGIELNPVAVCGDDSCETNLGDIVQVSVWGSFTCARTGAGDLKCWGRNEHGELGDGSMVNRNTPVDVEGAKPPLAPTATPTATPAAPTGTSMAPTAPSTTPAATPTPPSGDLPGGVDCNGVVNAVDAALVLQLTAGLAASLPCLENADVNNDDMINAVDAALILQFGAGLLPSLPP